MNIGITFDPNQDVFYSGANQTAIVLGELLKKLAHRPIFVLTRSPAENFSKMPDFEYKTVYDDFQYDIFIDIDAKVYPDNRTGKRNILFLRSFLQFNEMDMSVYPETEYCPRNYESVSEVWCWDILNPSNTLPSIQTVIPCPIRVVPFIWSQTVAELYRKDRNSKYDAKSSKWNVHICEKQNNASSPVMPLVAIRELHNKNVLDATYFCHGSESINDNKFFKENILHNIESKNLPIKFLKKQPYSDFLDTPNTLLFSHSRFVPLRIGLLNAIWLGIPVIHNSHVIRGIHPVLESLFYFGNEVNAMKTAITNFTTNPVAFYDNVDIIRKSILTLYSIESKAQAWKGFLDANDSTALQASKSSKSSKTSYNIHFDKFNAKSFILDILQLYQPSYVFNECKLSDKTDVVISGSDIKNTANKPQICINGDSKNSLNIDTWMFHVNWRETTGKGKLNVANLLKTPTSIPFNERKNECILFKDSSEICKDVVNRLGKVDVYDTGKTDSQLTDYKFTLHFGDDNLEDILLSKVNGCIPIYVGKSSTNHLNKTAFINLSGIANADKYIEVLNHLRNNSHYCEKIASVPILDESIFDTLNEYAKKILQAMY
jgi:Protein of unknown function (DUF2827)